MSKEMRIVRCSKGGSRACKDKLFFARWDVTACRYCGAPLVLVSEQERRALREAQNRIKKGDQS